jgi:hypothetical protein
MVASPPGASVAGPDFAGLTQTDAEPGLVFRSNPLRVQHYDLFCIASVECFRVASVT